MQFWWALTLRVALAFFSPLLTPSIDARAQQEITSFDEQKAAEFIRLIDHWQKSNDPEEAIAALEAALKLEPEMRQWPLQDRRERVRGLLLTGLGDSYKKRRGDGGGRGGPPHPVVFASLAAAWPGRMAARTPTALLLRSE